MLSRGELLSPSRIGALAAIGVPEVDLFERPRVAILSTGNEVIDPGQPLGPARSTTSTSSRWAPSSVSTEAFPSTIRRRPIRWPSWAPPWTAVGRTTSLVFSGGSSVGERDLTLDVLQQKGDVLFTGSRLNPASPPSLDASATSRCWVCLGTRPHVCRTPTCCWSRSCGVSLTCRLTPAARSRGRLDSGSSPRPGVTSSTRCASLTPPPCRHSKASGDITSMSQADGYIEIPAQTDIVEKGEMVEVKLF